MEDGQLPIQQIDERTVYELPRWVKILFRFYAVIFLLCTIVGGLELIHYVTTRVQGLPTVVVESLISQSGFIGIAVLAFVLVILILEILYGISVYKFRRWVLPLALTFSISTVLIGLLRLLNVGFTGIVDLIGLVIGMTFMGLVGYASIKYWSVFTGSARKLLIQIPLLLVLHPFIVFAILFQIFTDDSQIDDSDLILMPVEVLPESNNAHYSLPDINNLSVQEQQNYELALEFTRDMDGKNLNNSEAINVANQTKNLTDHFIATSGKSGYQCPTLVNDYSLDAGLCSLSDIKGLALLASFRAGVEADTGNPDKAVTTAVSIVRTGGLISNAEQPVLIEYLVGIALMNIGLESIERTLNNSTSTSNWIIASAISELEQSKAHTFADSLRREYMSMKDMSTSFEEFSNYFYQHNKTVNQRARLFRKQIAMSSLGCSVDIAKQQQEQEIEQLLIEMHLAPTTWPIISPNFIGKVLNSVVVASLNTVGQKGCEVNKRNQSVQELLKNNIIIEVETETADAG